MRTTHNSPPVGSSFPTYPLLMLLLLFTLAREASSADETISPAGLQDCPESLHLELNGQNKVYESSFLAERNAICDTARKTAVHYKAAGFSPTDAERATLIAWIGLKRNTASVISVNAFELDAAVKELRLLIVNSAPPGADVTIDEVKCQTPTECRCWVPQGKHKIVISKRGFQTEQTEQTVSDEKTTKIFKTLLPH
jgi:hypothetical protein